MEIGLRIDMEIGLTENAEAATLGWEAQHGMLSDEDLSMQIVIMW